MSASAGRMGPRPRLRVLTGGDETSASPSRRMGPEGAGGGLGRRFVSTALATAGAWLVEPAEVPDPAPDAAARSPARPRTVVAVFGLAPACGATVVARALAAELAARDPAGTAAVACEARASGIPLATQAAARLARALEDLPCAATRAVGRLCLIQGADHLGLAETSRHLAPLVLDAGSVPVGGVPAAVADATVLVGAPTVEPALARAAAGCLARMRAEAIVVFNRARAAAGVSIGEEENPAGAAVESGAEGELRLPHSRVGAQLALGGREARGDLGRTIAVLADQCELLADRRGIA